MLLNGVFMKLILGLSLSLLSTLAVAGPEEHRDIQTCYYPQLNSNTKSNGICLEEISVNLQSAELSIYSYFMPEMFKSLKVTTLTRRNENGFTLKTKGVLVNSLNSETCSGEHVSLIVNGQVDNDGVGEVQYLEISTETTKYDSHCNLNVQTLRYKSW